MRIRYGKLIRDRIPEIMDGEGVRYEVVELDDDAFRAALLVKLTEEAEEIVAASSTPELVEEIADLYEVLDALLVQRGIAAHTVSDVQRQRREERGGFDRQLELRWTEQER
jgi:predicted house-cleaning noncanonical NTP pyrophosphatase (MazG superfamily)